jgi:hypothetical protein
MAKRLKDLPVVTTAADTTSVLIVSDIETNLLALSDLRTTLLPIATTNVAGVVKVGANLTVDEHGVISALQSTLPNQTGNAGKYLATDGTNVSWQVLNFPLGLPTLTGNTGKYLKTNGITASWEVIPSRNVFPQYTATQRDGLNAVAGTVVWNTTATKLQVYTGTAWENLH